MRTEVPMFNENQMIEVLSGWDICRGDLRNSGERCVNSIVTSKPKD
jgi:hypothetical protein